MKNEEKQRLVSEVLARGGQHPELFDSERLIDSIESDLRAQGVEEETLAVMRILSRARRQHIRMMSEIGRKLFPIEPLPTGAVPIYDKPDATDPTD